MLQSQFDSHRHVKVLFFLIGVTYRERLGMLKPITALFPLLLPSGHLLMALLGGLWSRDPQCWGRPGDRGTSAAARDWDSWSKHSIISFGWCLYVGNQSSKPVFVCFCKLQCRKMVGCLVSVRYFPALSCAGAWPWEPLLKVGAAEVTTEPDTPRSGSASRQQREGVCAPTSAFLSSVGAPKTRQRSRRRTQRAGTWNPTMEYPMSNKAGPKAGLGVWWRCGRKSAHVCTHQRHTHHATPAFRPSTFSVCEIKNSKEGGHQKPRRQLTVRLKGTEFLKTKNSQDL